MPFKKGQIPNPTGKGGFTSKFAEPTKTYRLPQSIGDRLKLMLIDDESVSELHRWLDRMDSDTVGRY